ncbi:hypothetical protein C0431_10575 [bacterium]|nr:hypothetical protein [bacterium]
MKPFIIGLATLAASAAFGIDFGRVMLVGDSLTGGSNSPAPNSYRRALNDMLIAGNHQKDFVGPNNWGNFENGLPDNQHAGFGGWGVDEINTGLNWQGTNLGNGKLSDWMASYNPDTTVFFAGGNDASNWITLHNIGQWYNNPGNQQLAKDWYRDQFQQVLDTSFSQNPDMMFLFGSYPKNEKVNAVERAYNTHLYGLMAEVIRDMVAEQQLLGRDVRYVPIYENSSEVLGLHTHDQVHFNILGAEHTAGLIYDSMTEAVPEPGTMLLLAIGAGMLAKRRTRSK